jgi:hypothetical protein
MTPIIGFVAAAVLAAPPAATLQSPAPQPAPRMVKQIDSVWNGAVIGAGIGAVTGYVWGRELCGGDDDECLIRSVPVGLVIFTPAGAAAGALIDRLINKMVPAAQSSTTIAAGPKALGFTTTISFGGARRVWPASPRPASRR